jgi:hypothetical protein
VTCPNGLTRPITPRRGVTFGAGCRGCPLRVRCTSSKTGRSLTLHPLDAVTRAHRERAEDPAFQAVYRQHRPMVERSISWLVAGGNRRLRFRGTARNDQWLHRASPGSTCSVCSPLGWPAPLTLILASGSERGWLGTVQDPWWCESAYLTGK